MSGLLKQNKKIRPAFLALAGLLVLLLADTIFFGVISNFYLTVMPHQYEVGVFLLNQLPIIGVSVILWLLTARVLASFLLTAALFDAIFFANQLKLANLGQPLMAVDFISVVNVGGHGALLSNYFVSAWHPGILTALVIVSVLLLFFEKPTFPVKIQWRILIVMLLLVGLGTPITTDSLNSVYAPGEDWLAWSPRENLKNYGLLFCLAHDARTIASGNMEYDEDRLGTILQQNPVRLYGYDASLPVVENIIVILSESFFDPADLNAVAAGQYDLPAYTELQQRSFTGKIAVPAYGGITLRTEFELLTGIGLDLFPVHHYPLISLVTEPMNSIAWDLKREGYSTTGIHPNVASFWNRENAYPYLGFEEFIDIAAFKRAKRSGYYVSDNALTRKLKKEIRDGDKQFIFVISMENHGPWKTGRLNLDTEIVSGIDVPDVLEGESAVALQQYLYHQQLAEAALLELIKDLDSRKARSIVLFFGDHLPGLEQPFNDLEFKDGRSRYEQATPFLIYDTHRNLSAVYVPEPVVDVGILGSVLLDLSVQDLPEFHALAESLYFAVTSLTEVTEDQELSDLQQLQLWRFWQAPVNKEGEVYTAMALGQPEKDHLKILESLYCPIERWGPKKTYVGEPFNEQPDGRSAFYVKTECDSEDLEIRIDGRPLWTTKHPGILTAAIFADDLIKESGSHIIELHEKSTGRSQELGIFKVKKRWWPK